MTSFVSSSTCCVSVLWPRCCLPWLLVLPSLWELANGNLSAATLLVRLALALALCAVLVGMNVARVDVSSPTVGRTHVQCRESFVAGLPPDSGPLTPQLAARSGSLFKSVGTEDLLAELIETLDAELEQLTLLRFPSSCSGSLWLQIRRLPSANRSGASGATTDQLCLIDLRRRWQRPSGSPRRSSSILRCTSRDRGAGRPLVGGEMLHDRRRLLLEQRANIRSDAELTISSLGRCSTLLCEALSFLSGSGGWSYG